MPTDKPSGRPRPRREYLWRLPEWANQKFERLLTELSEYAAEEDRACAIREEIRGLPGFPSDSESYTLIRREVTTVH